MIEDDSILWEQRPLERLDWFKESMKLNLDSWSWIYNASQKNNNSGVKPLEKIILLHKVSLCESIL